MDLTMQYNQQTQYFCSYAVIISIYLLTYFTLYSQSSSRIPGRLIPMPFALVAYHVST